MPRERLAIELLDAVVGGQAKFRPFEPGELWFHTFDTSKGPVNVMGWPAMSADGNRLTLNNWAISPVHGNVLHLGTRETLQIIRTQIGDVARERGFKELGIEWFRLNGANPHKVVEYVLDLEKGGRAVGMKLDTSLIKTPSVSGGAAGEASPMEVASRPADPVIELASRGVVAEFAAEPGRVARGAVGGLGTIALGTGLVGGLAADGVLPQAAGDVVKPFNHVVGTVAAPFMVGHGDAAAGVTDLTGSHTAGVVADAALNAGAYGVAAAVAGVPGVVGLAAANGIDYLAGGRLSAATGAVRDGVRDFVTAGQNADAYLRDLGINEGPGSFGHALATEFRAGAKDVAHTDAALPRFGRFVESQLASGADLALQTPGGWGYADADRQERLMSLKDFSLQSAAHPNNIGGTVLFPDGTSGSWVDPSYANGTNELAYDDGYGGAFSLPPSATNMADPAPLQSSQLGESSDGAGTSVYETSDVYEQPSVKTAAIDQPAAADTSNVYAGETSAESAGEQMEVAELEPEYQPPEAGSLDPVEA